MNPFPFFTASHAMIFLLEGRDGYGRPVTHRIVVVPEPGRLLARHPRHESGMLFIGRVGEKMRQLTIFGVIRAEGGSVDILTNEGLVTLVRTDGKYAHASFVNRASERRFFTRDEGAACPFLPIPKVLVPA